MIGHSGGVGPCAEAAGSVLGEERLVVVDVLGHAQVPVWSAAARRLERR
jgi:hypothetical protein